MTILSVCHKHGLHPQGPCPTCTTQDNRRRNSKPKRRQWKTLAYQTARRHVLVRSQGLCELGYHGCTKQATSVDHADHDVEQSYLWRAACAHCHGVLDRQRQLAISRPR